MQDMNTDETFEINCDSSESTEKLGEQLGRLLKGGEVLELVSDLGGGKTTFVRGLANGAGSSDVVSSPTFVLTKNYRTPGFTIYHYDFFRLNDVGLMIRELGENINGHNVIIIEWGDMVAEVLPATRAQIQFVTTGDNSRKLIFKVPETYSYLKPALQ